jgi:hypothetical protein
MLHSPAIADPCQPSTVNSYSIGKDLRFWREAPLIGLTGVAEVEIGERGVIAERVAYDGNLASDTLRRSWTHRPGYELEFQPDKRCIQ